MPTKRIVKKTKSGDTTIKTVQKPTMRKTVIKTKTKGPRAVKSKSVRFEKAKAGDTAPGITSQRGYKRKQTSRVPMEDNGKTKSASYKSGKKSFRKSK